MIDLTSLPENGMFGHFATDAAAGSATQGPLDEGNEGNKASMATSKKPVVMAQSKSSTSSTGAKRGAVSKSNKREQAEDGIDDFESPQKSRENIAANKRKKVVTASLASNAFSKTGALAKLSVDPFSEIDIQMERIKKSVGGTRGGMKSAADAEDRLVHLVPILSKISDAQSKLSVLEQKVRVEMKKVSKAQYAASTSVIKEVSGREEINEAIIPSLFPRLSESEMARTKDWWNDTKLLEEVAQPANSAILSVEQGYKDNGLPLSQVRLGEEAKEKEKEVETETEMEIAVAVETTGVVAHEAAIQTEGSSSSRDAAMQTDKLSREDALVQTEAQQHTDASMQTDTLSSPSSSPSPPVIFSQATEPDAPSTASFGSSGENYDAIKVIAGPSLVASKSKREQLWESLSPADLLALDPPPMFAALSADKLAALAAELNLPLDADLPQLLQENRALQMARERLVPVAEATEEGDVDEEEGEGSDEDAVGPLPADSSAEAVFTLLRRHHASLYQKLLLFHPLELDEMHALTKAAKIKLGKDGLKKLLAQHGVFVSTNTKGKAGGGIKDLNGAKFKRW